MAINVLTVYLPFYFQATKGVSPATSGLYILALGIPNSLATVACGLAMTTTKYYVPYIVVGAVVLAVGSGLLSTLNVDSNLGQIIGCKSRSRLMNRSFTFTNLPRLGHGSSPSDFWYQHHCLKL